MSSVNLCNHIFHPNSQGKVQLTDTEKKYAKLGLLLLPFLIIPGLAAFWGLSYYFKHKALKNLNQAPNPSAKKVAKVFKDTKKTKHESVSKSSVSSTSSSSTKSTKLQTTGYAIDFGKCKYKTQSEGALGILKMAKVYTKASPDFPRPTVKGTNNAARRRARNVSSQFVDVFHPDVLKKQSKKAKEQFQVMQMKRIGHVFGLKERVDLPSGNMAFEGFFGEFTVPMIASSFSSFYQSLDKDHLPQHFDWLTPKSYQWIQDNLREMLSDVIVRDHDIQAITSILQEPDFKGPIAAGSGFDKHFTVVGFVGSIAFISNRGAHSKPSGIALYKLQDREVLTETSITDIVKCSELSTDSYFGHKAMVNELGGEPLTVLKLPAQDAGNCSYKSAEGYLCFLFLLQYLHSQDPDNFYDNLNSPELMQAAFEVVKPAFEQWVNYDRRMIYDDLTEDCEKMQQRPTNDRERKMYESTLNYVQSSEAYIEMVSYENVI